MAVEQVYVCDRCDHEVRQHDMPVVFIIHCGPVRAGAYVDPSDPELTPFERGLMSKPIPRIELCPTCLRHLLAQPNDAEFLADLFDEER